MYVDIVGVALVVYRSLEDVVESGDRPHAYAKMHQVKIAKIDPNANFRRRSPTLSVAPNSHHGTGVAF